MKAQLSPTHHGLVGKGALKLGESIQLENAHTQADGIIAQARDEVARLVEQTTIVSNARKEATRILAEANANGKKNREEIDQYVDARLATLEVILNKTLDVISKGRDQLGGVETKHALSDLNK